MHAQTIWEGPHHSSEGGVSSLGMTLASTAIYQRSGEDRVKAGLHANQAKACLLV